MFSLCVSDLISLVFSFLNFLGIGFVKEAFKSASNFLSGGLPEGPLSVKATYKYKAIYLSLDFWCRVSGPVLCEIEIHRKGRLHMYIFP